MYHEKKKKTGIKAHRIHHRSPSPPTATNTSSEGGSSKEEVTLKSKGSRVYLLFSNYGEVQEEDIKVHGELAKRA